MARRKKRCSHDWLFIYLFIGEDSLFRVDLINSPYNFQEEWPKSKLGVFLWRCRFRGPWRETRIRLLLAASLAAASGGHWNGGALNLSIIFCSFTVLYSIPSLISETHLVDAGPMIGCG